MNESPQQLCCPRCGQVMRPDTVRTAIWRQESLVVVEDIPAQVCDACVEQFYDDETTDALRRLMEEGFPAAGASREVLVPVFSLSGRVARKADVSVDAEDDFQTAY